VFWGCCTGVFAVCVLLAMTAVVAGCPGLLPWGDKQRPLAAGLLCSMAGRQQPPQPRHYLFASVASQALQLKLAAGRTMPASRPCQVSRYDCSVTVCGCGGWQPPPQVGGRQRCWWAAHHMVQCTSVHVLSACVLSVETLYGVSIMKVQLDPRRVT
jgi:hypothetical protein